MLLSSKPKTRTPLPHHTNWVFKYSRKYNATTSSEISKTILPHWRQKVQEQCWIQQKKTFQKLTSLEFWNINEIRKDFLKPLFVSYKNCHQDRCFSVFIMCHYGKLIATGMVTSILASFPIILHIKLARIDVTRLVDFS